MWSDTKLYVELPCLAAVPQAAFGGGLLFYLSLP